MFTLWYTVLSWREYRGLNNKNKNPSKESQDATPTTPKKESSRIPVVEPAKPKLPAVSTKPQTPEQTVVQPPPPIVQPPSPVIQPPTPPIVKPASPQPQPQPRTQPPVKPLAPPPSKIPRAPSPHVNNEAFDDIDFEEDDESDGDEDDEDSVVGSPWKPSVTPSRITRPSKPAAVNDFLNQERGQPKPTGLTGSSAQNSRNPSGIPKQEQGSGDRKAI